MALQSSKRGLRHSQAEHCSNSRVHRVLFLADAVAMSSFHRRLTDMVSVYRAPPRDRGWVWWGYDGEAQNKQKTPE
jgi:hypothetical protein